MAKIRIGSPCELLEIRPGFLTLENRTPIPANRGRHRGKWEETNCFVIFSKDYYGHCQEHWLIEPINYCQSVMELRATVLRDVPSRVIFDVSILAVLRKFVDTPDSGWVVGMVTWQFDEQSHLLRDRHRMRISRGKNRRRADAVMVVKQSFETAARILSSELKNCGSVNKYLSGNKYVTLPMDFPEVIAWHKRNANQISAAVLF